jgi:GH24 family phage-related lysozyme (muramidase)
MKVSARGTELVKSFEGFGGHPPGSPYRDPVGVWTIGYGHIEGVGPGSRRLTEPEAAALLRRDLDAKYAPAVRNLGLPLNQNQFDALVSFVYNVGPGGVSASTQVGRALRAKNWRAAGDALLAWDKAGGRTLPGLTRRRHAERALFLEPAVEDGPAAWLTPAELRWIREFDRGPSAERRRVLRTVMRQQRKRIWRAAQTADRGGDGRGWKHANRHDRYRSLLARSG